MTAIQPLDFSTQTLIDHLMLKYMVEKNFEMALALHRGLKWELVAIEHEDEIKRAAVRHPEGGIYDARGHQTNDEFLKDFDQGVIISFKLEAELNLKTRLIIEKDILEAGRLGMSAWPNLPWNKDTYFTNLLNFMNDLEKLSKYHGFWIKNTLNTIIPNGTGYNLYITGNGEYRIGLCHGDTK